MELTRSAISQNRLTCVSLVVVILAGMLVFFQLPRNLDPGFIVRWAVVMTHFPGASPERIEMLITDKIEKAVQELPELKVVTSTSKTGASIVSVLIKAEYKEMDPIWDDLRRKMEKIKSSLPAGVQGPSVLDDLGDVYGVVLTITGDGYDYAELREVADQVRDEILHIDDVAKVAYYGAQEERLFVEYNNASLARLGLSPAALNGLLASQNIINPGGQVFTEQERIVLEPTGNYESVADLKRTVIQLPGSADLVYLEDIANVYRGYVDPPATIVRASGMPAIGLGISLREGGNITTMGEAVKKRIVELQAAYPIGIEFDFQYFLPRRVDQTVNDFINNLVQAILTVLGVMLLTLGLRTGFLVAALIPVAIVATFMFMGAFEIGLDQVSLASLMIALGLLVDNAIVMAESILVQINRGKPRIEAAVVSAKELRVPLLVSSLTTAAAFLPIYLAKSAVGEYTASIFKVVTITLLCSWLLAMTMTPLLCVLFLRAKKVSKSETDRTNTLTYRWYRAFLLLLLRNRALTILATVGVFFAAMVGFGHVPQMFFPKLESDFFYGNVTLPMGTPIQRTAELTKKIESFVNRELATNKQRPEGITKYTSFIGGNEPIFVLGYSQSRASPEVTMFMFNTTSTQITNSLIERLHDFCRKELPDAEASFQPLAAGPPVRHPIEVRISSRDTDELFGLVDQVKEKLMQTPGTRNISDDWGRWTKKLVVKVDQERARKAGLSSKDVAASLKSMLSGQESTQYREKDKVIPVMLRSVAADRNDIVKIEGLNAYSQAGRPVPLKQVADFELQWEPSQVLRRNRYRTVSIKSELTPGANAAAIVQELAPWIEELQQKANLGTTFELGGEDEEAKEANESIGDQMPIAMLLILLLLVGQFNSLRKTLIILTTILLGLIGVSFGLLVMKSYFGFMTLLGVISLAGIVINNAIVLLDRIKIEQEQNGLEAPRAVVQAAQMRLRPILLTTATTIGGLIPLYLGGGPMWQPMAVAIMFGLLISTVLTLGIVPTLYSALFRVRYKNFQW